MSHMHNCQASTSSVVLDDTAATSSTASLPTPDHQPQTKKAKFEERYNTDENSDTDVLVSGKTFQFITGN
jgi:hypothetical protein